jgi:hypothetical protein
MKQATCRLTNLLMKDSLPFAIIIHETLPMTLVFVAIMLPQLEHVTR